MTDTHTKVGRKPGFDRDHVVEATAALFWANGYDGVSLSDIMSATGLSKSSLYNSFGDKDALFQVALAHYGDNVVETGAAWLAADDGSDPIEKLGQLLSGPINAAYAEDDLRGCFLCNTAADGQMNIPEIDQLVGMGFKALEDGLTELLRRYRPEASDTLRRRFARLALSVYIGLNVRSRVKPPRAVLEDIKNGLITVIESGLPDGQIQ